MKQAVRASPAAGAVRRFRYSDPEPWSWLPGTWIHAGIIFITSENRFYRFSAGQDDGWDCDELAREAVGSPTDIARVIETRLAYEKACAARAELETRMQGANDTAEARSLLRDRTAELDRLRYLLVELCNLRAADAREQTTNPERPKLVLAGVLAAAFVLALVYCAVTLLRAVPGSAGRWIAQAVAGILVLAGATYGAMMLVRHKNRLLQNSFAGNILGCIIIIVLFVLGVGFLVALFLASRAF